jgi:hypothetical protein
VELERGGRGRRPVLGRRPQPVRAPLVILDVLVVGVLEHRAVRGDALDVGRQAPPAREAVLARGRVEVAAAARQVPDLLAKLFDRRGHSARALVD